MSNISTREAQARVEAATPSKLMVPTIYLTHHEQQEYIAHMQKGVEQFLRVLHKTRDVFSVFRADVKEKTSRAGEKDSNSKNGEYAASPQLISSRRAGVTWD